MNKLNKKDILKISTLVINESSEKDLSFLTEIKNYDGANLIDEKTVYPPNELNEKQASKFVDFLRKNKQLEGVKTFHETFLQPILYYPQVPNQERCELRYKLIEEELNEFKDAYEANDIVESADALIDLLYVVYGSILEFGLTDIADKLFDEVQASNMSKLDENGNILYKPNGKVAKSNLFKEPDLKSIIEAEQIKLKSNA